MQMAMNDDEEFLIQHLRNCFITSDDSGLCEALIDVETERASSPDITSDIDYGNRLRSGTKLRIEKIRKEKNERSKVKSVKWQVASSPLDEESIAELFPVRDVTSRRRSSELTRLLRGVQGADNSNSAFSQYRQFDGKNHVTVKNLQIYLTMEEKFTSKRQPIDICVLTSARVEETIGLICYKYTEAQHQPPLPSDISLFSLHIVEDDGQVDDDFPALNKQELISKFGFSKLALLQASDSKATSKVASSRVNEEAEMSVGELVTVHIPGSGTSKLRMPDDKVTIATILSTVLEKRKLRTAGGKLKYHLEQNDGVAVDEQTELGKYSTREFYLIRENSASDIVSTVKDEKMHASAKEIHSTFTVVMVTKLFSNTQVQLSFNDNRLDIQPIASKNTSMRQVFGQKPSWIDIQSILRCEITKTKPGKNLSAFVIHYLSADNNVKRYNFEAAESVAMEIVTKLNEWTEYSGVHEESKEGKKRRKSSMY